MYVSTMKNTEMYVNIHLDLLKETSLMYVFFYCNQAAMQTIGRPMQRRKRMNGNVQKEEIYRTTMRICRMWGVAETLDHEIPPFENPKAKEALPENQALVLKWAEEYMALQNGDCELWSFFITKIKGLAEERIPELN